MQVGRGALEGLNVSVLIKLFLEPLTPTEQGEHWGLGHAQTELACGHNAAAQTYHQAEPRAGCLATG